MVVAATVEELHIQSGMGCEVTSLVGIRGMISSE